MADARALLLLVADDRRLLAAAQRLGMPVDVLCVAPQEDPVWRTLPHAPGVERLLQLPGGPLLPEDLAPVLVDLARDYTHMLAPADPLGRGVMPRVAAQLGVSMLSEVVGIESPRVFARPVHAGDLLAILRSDEELLVLTVRPGAFAPLAGQRDQPLPVTRLPAVPAAAAAALSHVPAPASGLPSLANAPVVVAGGAGLGSRENFQRLLLPLAHRLGAAIGATRAAVDAGYAPSHWQIGQSGWVVAPRLYLAIGISGAVQHVAGFRDAQTVIAINRDPEAPIFRHADYGLVGDLSVCLPELLEYLSARCQ